MAKHDGEIHLPRVDDVDLASALLEDILDPTHIQRWFKFADENPALMQEILRRANDLAAEAKSSNDISKGAIDMVTFTLDALEKALERTHHTPPSDDDDGEVPPLST